MEILELIYNTDSRMIWLVLVGVFFVLEILTPTTIFIFPALAALIAWMIGMFIPSVVLQTLVFFVLAGISIFRIPSIIKKSQKKEYVSGVEALIGAKVRVIETINNDKDQGRVKYASDEFPARSLDNTIIKEQSLVEVVRIDGIKLYVKESS